MWKYGENTSQHRDDRYVNRYTGTLKGMLQAAVRLSPAKVETIKVTSCILLAHTFCWAPYFTVALLNVWSDHRLKEVISNTFLGVVAQYLCWFSSCLNPLIYGLFSLSAHPKNCSPCCPLGQKQPSSLLVGGKLIPYRERAAGSMRRMRRHELANYGLVRASGSVLISNKNFTAHLLE